MNGRIEIKQRALRFDVKNTTVTLLVFRNLLYRAGKYTSQKIIDFMGFITIIIHCNEISGVEDNGNDTDILYTFNLIEPPGYLINIIPTNVPYQKILSKEKNI